jgi:hypothetical protein
MESLRKSSGASQAQSQLPNCVWPFGTPRDHSAPFAMTGPPGRIGSVANLLSSSCGLPFRGPAVSTSSTDGDAPKHESNRRRRLPNVCRLGNSPGDETDSPSDRAECVTAVMRAKLPGFFSLRQLVWRVHGTLQPCPAAEV